MPVNFPQIQQQVRQMGAEALRTRQALHQKLEQARYLLAAADANPDALKQRIEQAYALNQNLRCAAPTDEPLGSIHLLPELPGPFTLLAADGSQINPDRHAPVEFCVINLGAFRMQPGQAVAPREITRSELIYKEEDLYTADGRITEEIVALRRDLLERRLLAELARQESGPVVALTDGPMELFRKPEASVLYSGLMDQFIAALRELNDLGTISAGYVDKPAADLVVRMLGILDPASQDSGANGEKSLSPLSDAFLFRDRIPPQARSAIFAIHSRSAQSYPDVTALHFFYLNTGFPGKPSLARVEIPAWVAADTASVNLLHAVLLEQCSLLGGMPYPYALHRSHEIALVSNLDKDQIEQMISREMIAQGMNPPAPSNKQFTKNLAGRTRNR